MRVLVTGATGFIGGHLVNRLVAGGHAVAVIVRDAARADRLPAAVERIAYATDGRLAASMAMLNPSAVIHLASRYVAEHHSEDVGDLISSNIAFGAHLLDAMAQCNVTRLLNFGTSFQHYTGNGYNPVSLYAATKQAFEDIAKYYVESRGFSVLTLKLSDTYGPDDSRGKIVSLLKRAAFSAERLALSPGEQIVNFAYCDDVVAAVFVGLERVMASPDGTMEAFAVRGNELLTLRAFVDTFAAIAGRTVDVDWGAKPYREREVMHPWLGELLPNWQPRVDLESGLRSVLND